MARYRPSRLAEPGKRTATARRIQEEHPQPAGGETPAGPSTAFGPPPNRARPRRRWPGRLAIALAVLAAVGVGLYVAAYQGLLGVDPGLLPDIHARSGSLYGDGGGAEPPGSFRATLNQQPVMRPGETACNLRLENVSANHYACQVELVLNETGETLYASHRLSPGRYIESVELSRALEAGAHPCTVYYRAFDGVQPVGTLELAITIYVREGTA
ncbi:hypothetical protein [Pseudoflavonifractor phocaeensis]|uniref:hypothetical protein n=1 Tax=Pseudoflavonifractor phocaeensis TaxID=1870988 RepID=UPI00210D9D5E|nr:hypothetical protein [Pseudoflavonifractor phocaeensis]MCQ4863510.1 hypothetical protein [Pseudoflavonifractor phocaeensis]